MKNKPIVISAFALAVLATLPMRAAAQALLYPGSEINGSFDAALPDLTSNADGATTVCRQNEMVFLLHGIAKGQMDMAPMARYLRKNGYTVVNWHYPSTEFPLCDLADKLATEIGRFPNYRIHFVTHSMGGIVVRTCLSRHPMENLGRIVMIAPPSQGAEMAKFFGNWGLYKYLMGPAGQELKPADLGKCASAGTPGCEFGIIAGGTGSSRGINPLLPGDNDGTVTVASTRLEGEKDFTLVPYPHPVIQMMPKTSRLTLNFLETGHFHPEEALSESQVETGTP